MNERARGSAWLKKFQLENPDALVCRIPDSPVCRKPFDAFTLLDGVFVAIEFKLVGEELLSHQLDALRRVKANGGVAKVIYFGPDGKAEEVEL